MHYEAKNVVYGRDFLSTMLLAIKTVPGAALLVAPKVRLSKDALFNPLPGSVIADFTANEADFSGYTAGGYAPTLSGVVNLGANLIGLAAGVMPTCSGAGAPSPNTVYGWWIDDGTNFVVGEKFANGLFFTFQNPGDFLDLAIALPLALLQAAA
jgi:hypothetical protein